MVPGHRPPNWVHRTCARNNREVLGRAGGQREPERTLSGTGPGEVGPAAFALVASFRLTQAGTRVVAWKAEGALVRVRLLWGSRWFPGLNGERTAPCTLCKACFCGFLILFIESCST